eukprot:CAMPEP_0115881432 /NCGR_PEP_ID=MMETSP0287-20121206/28432_1 /TAXON_ID=412157 /ORGANISM="Chrysochromulina rotalis, Strain UIO044" /LENGTH=77 /DNA_ID=CAMNT_0003337371 /DNA_START=86 /DNA_END=320 /DNA_ORIENTATION=+
MDTEVLQLQHDLRWLRASAPGEPQVEGNQKDEGAKDSHGDINVAKSDDGVSGEQVETVPETPVRVIATEQTAACALT